VLQELPELEQARQGQVPLVQRLQVLQLGLQPAVAPPQLAVLGRELLQELSVQQVLMS
jgi:hypothetical protein